MVGQRELGQKKTVLVLGAGINGVAIARELLLNGVPVCLIDRWDIAGGTTAYSSRLIHGGLRYLEYGDFALVRESLTERERLLKLAPQFVRPLELFIPIERRASGITAAAKKFFGWPTPKDQPPVPRGMWLVRMGLFLYDFLSRGSSMPRHRGHRLTEPGVPPVNRQRFRWLASYYDAQIVAPERFVIAMLEDARQIAADQGVPFSIHTYCTVDKSGPTVSWQVASESERSAPMETGELDPALIINATGAWVDESLAQMGIESPQLMGGTKGSHFLTRHPGLEAALRRGGVYAEAADGRPVFLLPFGSYSLVGTTDLPADVPPEDAVAGEDELHYLVHAVRDVFPHVTLTRGDVDFHYCGVRPLPRESADIPASITRRHMLHVHENSDVPLISIVGGKLTTCRSLAEETAELVLKQLNLPVCQNSRERPVPGGRDYPDSNKALVRMHEQIAQQVNLTSEQVHAVWQLCGTRTAEMLVQPVGTRSEGDDDANLADTQLPVRFVQRVIRQEWCRTLEDLVERRLMLLYSPVLTRACLNDLAVLMVEAGLLHADQVDRAVQRCVDRLRDHFGRVMDENI
jgi:glycerol-3-phosphate dehydrogenase